MMGGIYFFSKFRNTFFRIFRPYSPALCRAVPFESSRCAQKKAIIFCRDASSSSIVHIAMCIDGASEVRTFYLVLEFLFFFFFFYALLYLLRHLLLDSFRKRGWLVGWLVEEVKKMDGWMDGKELPLYLAFQACIRRAFSLK